MTSTVIKGGGARSPRSAAFSFDDIARQADKYLDEIRSQAAKIIADANRQANDLRARAEQEGRQAALAAAERILDDKVRKQMESLLPALREVVGKLLDAKGQWLAHWEKSAVHLAAAIAERVMRRELEKQPEIALALVKESLELSVGAPKITIQLHPADHEALAGQVRRLADEFARLAPAEIVADLQITRGGCRVETEFGVIDQRFESQLARIEQELT